LNVPVLTDCFGSSNVVPIFQLTMSIYQHLLTNTLEQSHDNIAAHFKALQLVNSSCPIDNKLGNMSLYLPFINGVFTKDDRISVAVIGEQLKGNATAAQNAVSPLSDYVAVSLQKSSHYALFWVPVLCCWLILPIAHVIWARTSDTVQALQ
jgi:hypothetical protein